MSSLTARTVLGTSAHEVLSLCVRAPEQLVNGYTIEEPHSPEFQQAQAAFECLCRLGLEPYRAEINLVHCGLRVCGQARR